MNNYLLLIIAFIVIGIIQCYIFFTANQVITAKIKQLKAGGKDIKIIRETLSAEGYKKREITNAITALANGKLLSVGNLLFSILVLVLYLSGILSSMGNTNSPVKVVFIVVASVWLFINMYIKSKNPLFK